MADNAAVEQEGYYTVYIPLSACNSYGAVICPVCRSNEFLDNFCVDGVMDPSSTAGDSSGGSMSDEKNNRAFLIATCWKCSRAAGSKITSDGNIDALSGKEMIIGHGPVIET